MASKEKVMLGCPVQNREWILPRYLQALDRLVLMKDDTHMAFYVNNSKDDTLKILEKYEDDYGHMYHDFDIVVDETFDYTDIRNGMRDYAKIAEVKNKWVELRNKHDNLLFMVDSDIIVSPQTFIDLFYLNCDIAGALVLNAVLDGIEYYNMMRKVYGGYSHIRNLRDFIDNGERYIDVDVTGACALYRANLFDNPRVEFGEHSSGEDIYLCERVREEFPKAEIYCDLQSRVQHIPNRIDDCIDPTHYYIR